MWKYWHLCVVCDPELFIFWREMTESHSIERSCLELAEEGERLCKMGDCQRGVEHFRMALQAGTNDLILMSAIYSQMGNAYFYLQQYDKALEYHRYDLQLSVRLNHKIGEAKAYGNIGNTFKVIGRFEEAVSCCRRHLGISQEISDRIGEARALYSLGNIYFAEAKKSMCKSRGDSESVPSVAREALDQAIDHYEANLKIVTDLKDKSAIGRTCGNLGSSYYLLGDYEKAIKYHLQRLNIAKEFGDKIAERRACSNIGNAFVFKGEYTTAADYYKKALDLAHQLGDRSLEGHIFYSLGNVHLLLNEHENAIEYFLQHLNIAKEFDDASELSSSYWSLGNAFVQAGEMRKALEFTRLHFNISSKMGNVKGQQVALEKLNQLSAELDVTEPAIRRSSSSDGDKFCESDQVDVGYTRRYRSQRYDDHTRKPANEQAYKPPRVQWRPSGGDDDQEQFFDWLSEFQSRRMDDQRCSYRGEIHYGSDTTTSCLVQNDHDFNAVFSKSVTGRGPSRDENRSSEKSSMSSKSDSSMGSGQKSQPDEALLNLLINFQSNRYEDQRSPLPSTVTRGPHVDPQSATYPVLLDRQNDRSSVPDSTTEGDNPLRSIFSGISKLTGSKNFSKKRKQNKFE